MLEEKLSAATKRIMDSTKPIEVVSPEEAKEIIAQYTAAVEGNFVPWMCASVIYCRSLQGRYAASENLDCEIRDDHQGMLRRFAKSAEAEPEPQHYERVREQVENMRYLVGERDGLLALAVMAAVENTSLGFIPYLAELAKLRGSEDLEYTDIHGEADIDHAKQFVWALEHEIKEHEVIGFKIDRAIKGTVDYFSTIFSV